MLSSRSQSSLEDLWNTQDGQWALESITTSKSSGSDRIPTELFQILKDDAGKVLHSICQQIWKTQQWPQDRKRSIFISIPKKDNAKKWLNYFTIALISHEGKQKMFKILQARLQQYVNWELLDVQDGLRKGRRTRDQIGNIHWIIEKARVPEKHILLLIDYAKAFDCVNHNKLWTILQDIGIPDHLACLLRKLYACQKVRVTTEHGTMDWFQIGKGACQACILSPCLFNLYSEFSSV